MNSLRTRIQLLCDKRIQAINPGRDFSMNLAPVLAQIGRHGDIGDQAAFFDPITDAKIVLTNRQAHSNPSITRITQLHPPLTHPGIHTCTFSRPPNCVLHAIKYLRIVKSGRNVNRIHAGNSIEQDTICPSHRLRRRSRTPSRNHRANKNQNHRQKLHLLSLMLFLPLRDGTIMTG